MTVDERLREAKRGHLSLDDLLRQLRHDELFLEVSVVRRGAADIRVVEDGERRPFAVLHTGVDRLGAGVQFLATRGADFAKVLPTGTGAAINPEDPETTIALGLHSLLAMAETGREVAVGAPADEVPEYLTEQVVHSLGAARISPSRAYFFQLYDRSRGSRLVLGIEPADAGSSSDIRRLVDDLSRQGAVRAGARRRRSRARLPRSGTEPRDVARRHRRTLT